MTGDANACECWDSGHCEGTRHCPPRCPRFVDQEGDRWLVTPYEPTDLEPLLATYTEFVDEDAETSPEERVAGTVPNTEGGVERWLEQLLDAGCNFVAKSNGTVVGHAAYAPTDATEPELSVFVLPKYRGRGIGTELCKHVVATAGAANRDGLVVEVGQDERDVVRMFERLGFERAVEFTTADDIKWRTDALQLRHPLAEQTVLAAQRPPLVRS